MRTTVTTAVRGGFTPQLMRAVSVMRMGGNALAAFLHYHGNPCLAIGGALPPPPLIAEADGIRDELRRRCLDSPPSSVLHPYVQLLIECVDDDGFLRVDEEWDFDAATIASAIAHLQAIAPTGVAARDLSEALMLQLAILPPSAARTAAEKLVSGYLPWLQRKRWDKLPKKNLTTALPLLQNLSPSPAAAYAPVAAPRSPDVVFEKRRGLWRAAPGDGLSIAVATRRNVAATAAERAEAAAIAAAVRARRRHVLRAAQLAADMQSGFFSDGAQALRPFSLATAARQLDISPSMLSHIVADKLAFYADGSFPLKYLFQAGSNGVAVAAIQEKIRTMLASESTAQPLSDAHITRLLREQGLILARRTVAKHRRLAGIHAASLRKGAVAASVVKEKG